MWVLRTDTNTDTKIESLTFRVLPGGRKTIGRGPHADFVLNAAMVSRLHCLLTADIYKLQVEDLDSTNGTFVNGRRVDRSTLSQGDRLQVGRINLIVTRESKNNENS